MRISSFVINASCLSTMALYSASALSGSGEIVFSGSIVEPTCSFASAQSTTAVIATSHPDTLRSTCTKTGVATAAAPQTYVTTVKRLSNAESDRVLKYFDTYVKASRPDAADPTLLTQTYD
jgi:type 1 fimbria pilin